MAKKAAVLLAVILLLGFSVPSFCTEEDDYISTGNVDKTDVSDTLQSDTVDAIPTAEPVATVAPKPTPKPKPKPTVKPTPKPKPKAKPRATFTYTATYTPTEEPTPTATPIVPPDFNIAEVTSEEVVREKNAGNWFGLLDMIFSVKKLNVHVLMANKASAGGAMNASAELLSSDAAVLITNGKKDLQNVLAGDTREMNFIAETTKGYKGPDKLPLLLKIKADSFERDYPVDVSVKKQNWMLFLVIGLLALIVILLIVIAIKR